MSVRRAGTAVATVVAAFLAASVPSSAGFDIATASGQPPVVHGRSSMPLKVTGVASAHLGDGVCAASFRTNGIGISAAPGGVTPQHSESAAITASFQELTDPFRSGHFAAYFADVGTRPTWVVEVNDLNYPWEAGGILHQELVFLHHVVEFLDDRTLTSYEGFGCP